VELSIRLAARLYAALLRLYPRRFRDEFADEMRTVFSQALAEAAKRGMLAVLALVVREARDIPGSIWSANLHARGGLTVAPLSETEKRMGWLGVLIGILPFVLLGPLQAIMPYAPSVVRAAFDIGRDQVMIEFWLLMGVGTLMGRVWQFPRWSYPYLTMFVFVLLANGVARITVLLPQERFLAGFYIPLLFGFFVILTALIVLVARLLTPLHLLYQSVRQDWTRLSFGLFCYIAFATGFYGGDHPPPFGISVLLPTVIVVLGALLHLLSSTRRQRILALFLPPVLLPLTSHLEADWWFAVLFMISIISLPLLFDILRRDEMITPA
jgi:hypothetical protein